jgi:hypothetical protein
MHQDHTPDQSTPDMAAVFMALIRAADEGVDVGDQIMTVGATLRTRTCRDLQDVAAFFAVARMIYAKAAAYGLRAADYPPYAQQIAPLMGDGDFYFLAALGFIEQMGSASAPPSHRKDRRLN